MPWHGTQSFVSNNLHITNAQLPFDQVLQAEKQTPYTATENEVLMEDIISWVHDQQINHWKKSSEIMYDSAGISDGKRRYNDDGG